MTTVPRQQQFLKEGGRETITMTTNTVPVGNICVLPFMFSSQNLVSISHFLFRYDIHFIQLFNNFLAERMSLRFKRTLWSSLYLREAVF